jgi:putative ABC transport system permease protein
LDELSYDRYHSKADNIYRVVTNIKEPDNAFTWAVAQIPLAEQLKDNYPEVVNAVRFFGTSNKMYKNGEQQFLEKKFFLADSTVFDMFDYSFLEGDVNTALDAPFSLVLTKSIATKYFGSESALGQSLQTDNGDAYKVTAIIEDVPLNSHFRFDALISRNTFPKLVGGWGNFGVFTYLQLPPGYDISKMNEPFEKIIKEKVNPIFEQFGISMQYELQKITDIHLHSKIQDEAEEGGDISYVYIFGAVAVFMLLIGCINYMNLATARSANRAKEVGLRKVMGSPRGQLITQFLVESVLLASFALVISMILIYALLPIFNTVANKAFTFQDVMQPYVISGLIGMLFVTGVLSGSYPAFYLSSFNPVTVLKGKLSSRGGNVGFRKFLVVIQFSISIFMLISTLIVMNQLNYIRSKDLGYDKTRVLKINVPPALRKNMPVLANKLKQNSVVEGVGQSSATPGQGISKTVMKVEDNEGKLVDRGVDFYTVDYDFIDVMSMSIAEGRGLSLDFPSDTIAAVLVNEAMVNRMGWENGVGRKVAFDDGPAGLNERIVVGVVKDYHQNSLYQPIEPLLILLGEQFSNLFVRIKPGNITESIAAIEKTWKEVYADFPLEFTFLDDDFQSQYKSDEKRSQIFSLFSILTMVIACLGLLGLAAFTTEQRTKEIGIRKVIGASVGGLVALVSREFFALVCLGLVIAIPVAWYFTNTWLENFAYRIEIGDQWPTFIISAVLALVITFITVGYHVIKSANSNPVNALRDQ